jgi:hypothetical protein
MLKIPAKYDRDITSDKFNDIYRQLPASLLGVLLQPESSGGWMRNY